MVIWGVDVGLELTREQLLGVGKQELALMVKISTV
jgi:hypothetical protein